MRRLALLLSLWVLAGVSPAPTWAESLPPSGTLLRITTGGVGSKRPTALSDRFVVYQRPFDAVVVYDRDARTTREVAPDFEIGVAASDEHVAWQTPFSTVRFLKLWDAASGTVSFVDTARSGALFRGIRFIGRRLLYSNDLFGSIRIFDPATGGFEDLDPGCTATSWDATRTFVAWSCTYDGRIAVRDLESGVTTAIVSPPRPNSRPERIALADEWVVWVVERTSPADADLLAAPLAGGPVRTLAAGLLRDSTVSEFDAGGGFAAWWDRGRLQLHDFAANATVTVGDPVLRRPPRLTRRYLMWLEGFDPQQEALRIRNLATGLEMVDDLADLFEFPDLQVNEDSLAYARHLDNQVYLFEVDGDGDGIRDRDERHYALGDLDDADGDGDGILDGAEDLDVDGLGSADEIYVHGTDPTLADSDGDGLDDAIELFELGTDPLLADTDGDSISDSADECPLDPVNDLDADGVCGSGDNCPAAPNPDQSDLDEDGTGDACDPDLDGDGVPNHSDGCPFDPDPDRADFDGDGVGDACDADRDGDAVADAQDACVPTEPGEVVNDDGCSIAQLCPCERDWRSPGAYVSCVARAAGEFKRSGLIRGPRSGRIVAAASRSSCGKPAARFERGREEEPGDRGVRGDLPGRASSSARAGRRALRAGDAPTPRPPSSRLVQEQPPKAQ